MNSTLINKPSRLAGPGAIFRWMSRWKTFTIGLIITCVFILMTVLAPLIAPYPPNKANYKERLAPPSLAHICGTDEHGRDIFSRLLYGGRVSLMVGGLSILLASLIGIPLGLTTAFHGGRYDAAVNRFNDGLFAFPSILWSIAIVAILGPSELSALLAIGIARIPVTIRLSRAALLTERGNEYVEASRALGSSSTYTIFRVILPNALGPILVMTSLGFAVAILAEAGLSYLGLSVQPPTPSWGNMLQQSQRYLSEAPWLAFFSGLTLFLVVLGLNLVGDGVRDLFDPRREQGRT
jgi:peptide/nickel transport system permease protein